ncbi:hypothetical protein [Paenibacillus sp.]|nr:hypothetical protein [Paenibacillus sp.]MDR0270191.1 hypothetical protein [Paenibacillus sp.]
MVNITGYARSEFSKLKDSSDSSQDREIHAACETFQPRVSSLEQNGL